MIPTLKTLLIRFSLLLLFTCSFNSIVFSQTMYKEELRGIWITNVDSDVLNSKEKIAEAMDYLARQGFNIVYPVVWNKGFTLYPSNVADTAIGVKQDSFFASQGRDPLAELIVEAHRNGMEVVPWFEYGFASSFSLDGGHIIAKHPNWAAKNIAGEIVVKNGFDWMNAIHPEVQDFMNAMIKEVLTNYDVDGIQGDDRLPAMAAEGGYDDYTYELYKSEHNGAEPSSQFNSSVFLAWKADKLTNYLGRLYRMVKAHDPNLLVSLSPSLYDFSYRNYLQDWPTWLDSGYVDLLHPQNYRYNIADYKNEVNRFVGPSPGSTAGIVKPVDRHRLFPGVLIKAGNNLNGLGYVKQVINYHRQYGIYGEVFFFYEGLRERNEFVGDSIGALFYSEPAILEFREGKIRRPKALIVNETDSDVEKTGSWTLNDTPDGFKNKSLKANPGTGAELRYIADVPYAAYYSVYAWSPFNSGATSEAEFTIHGSSETQSTKINQRIQTNKGWKKIGNVFFERGLQKIVSINADASLDNRPVFADAVMLILDRKQSPDVDISVLTVGNEEEQFDTQPSAIQLHQNYPNPFNPSTTIAFDLDQSSLVSLEVFNMLGQRVLSLVSNQMYSVGTHRIELNASTLASGNYIYRLQTEKGQFAKILTLIK